LLPYRAAKQVTKMRDADRRAREMDRGDAPLLVLVPEAEEEVAVEVPVGLDSEETELTGADTEALEAKVVEGF